MNKPRAKRYVPTPTVFVLEIDQRPILAFEARSAREAQELTKEEWLRDDLRRLVRMVSHSGMGKPESELDQLLVSR